jgi:hypothetical protein
VCLSLGHLGVVVMVRVLLELRGVLGAAAVHRQQQEREQDRPYQAPQGARCPNGSGCRPVTGLG